MAQAAVTERVARRSPLEFAVDRIWRFFCSVRAAVYEIAILAIFVLIGTLRGSSVPNSIGEALPVTQPLIDRWYAFDVFHSLPFIAMLALISIAITICTMNRAPGIWQTIAHPTVGTTRGFLTSAETSAHFATARTPSQLAADLGETLRERRYRVLTETKGDEIHLYADKHRWAKLGTFPFHLALILILVGGIVGARYGFRETEFVIPEGSTRDVGRGTGLSVKLEQFSDSWRENGTPIDYRSDLILYKNGKEVKRQSIRVNHPMTYRSTVFYQTSFGQAITLRVTDAQGRIIFDDSVPLQGWTASGNPDAPAGVQPLTPIGAQLNVISSDSNPLNAPELDKLRLLPGEIFLQLRYAGSPSASEAPSAIVGQGDTVALGDLRVEFVRERRYTLLQVANNPGIPIFWAAAFLLVGGLAITFYFPHRRVRGIIAQPPGMDGGSEARLVPLAKRDWSGQRDFFRFVEELERRLDVAPTLKGQTEARVGHEATA